ncbi:MAG: CoA pyrophosphatase [Candidatus Eremiobacterota bacterium]
MKVNAKIKDKILDLLSARKRISAKDNGSISAAVLIPIFFKHGEEHLLFTKRTETVETHRGQISFPGGVRDKSDKTLEETALRESFEEIGLIREDIDTLGALDDFITGTGYCIYPLVGIIPYPYDFKVSEKEVAEILEVPVSTLLDRRNYIEDRNYIYKGKPYDYCAFKYGKHNIWGTTGRIVRNFLTLFYGWNFIDRR